MQSKLTESYNHVLDKAGLNKAQDELDSAPIENPRILSQFEDDHKGSRQPYSDLMRSFRPGSLLQKNLPMPKRKRFGVMHMDALRNT